MLPSGVIILWSGAIVDIPAGWVICDGNNGTPDLRDRFIEGAGGARAPRATGGNPLHNHTFTGDGHTHSLAAGTGLATGAVIGRTTTSVPATGTTDNTETRPPWYALAYIMFL